MGGGGRCICGTEYEGVEYVYTHSYLIVVHVQYMFLTLVIVGLCLFQTGEIRGGRRGEGRVEMVGREEGRGEGGVVEERCPILLTHTAFYNS